MKISIDLEETYADDETIAAAIRSEIEFAIRNEVKRQLKLQKDELRKNINAVVSKIIKNPKMVEKVLSELVK